MRLDTDAPVLDNLVPTRQRQLPAYPFDWDADEIDEPAEVYVPLANPIIELQVEQPQVDQILVESRVHEELLCMNSSPQPPAATEELGPLTSSQSRWTSRETVLVSLLAFCMGGLLVGAVDRMHARDTDSESHRAVATTLRALQAERKELLSEIQKVGTLVEERTSHENPSPVTATDLAPLREAIQNAHDSIAAVEKRLPDSKELGAKIDGLGMQLNGVLAEVGKMPELVDERIAKREVAQVTEIVHEVATPAALAAVLYERGVSAYSQGSFADADALFRACRVFDPEDAVSWYYGALAHGYATRDWTGEAVKLVAAGVKLEKANPGARARIDAALASLPPARGGDWLAFHRKKI